MMKRILLSTIVFLHASSCASLEQFDLLGCSENIVERHYAAIYSKDIDGLNNMHGHNIDWTYAFSEQFSHEVIEKNIVGSNMSGRSYVRVKEKYRNRVVYMNFSIMKENVGCRIVSFNADEP